MTAPLQQLNPDLGDELLEGPRTKHGALCAHDRSASQFPPIQAEVGVALRTTRLFPLVLVFAFALGCRQAPVSPVLPPASGNVSAPKAPEAPDTSSALSSVVIEDPFAIRGPSWTCPGGGQPCQPGAGYIYEVRLLLRESSGRSGATIKSIDVSNPNPAPGGTGSQGTGESCWVDTQRAPPGGTLDTFYTDAGSRWLSYCYVGIDGPAVVSSLKVDVRFQDDDGHAGSVAAVVSSFR